VIPEEKKMKRILVVLVLMVFCISRNSFAENTSTKETVATRGPFLVGLLIPVLAEAGKSFIGKFMGKTSDMLASKILEKPPEKKTEVAKADAASPGDNNANSSDLKKPEVVLADQKIINLALLAKVWQVKESSVQVVDPVPTVFKKGDLIYLEVAVSSPGIMEAYNKTPKGKRQKIGTWTIAGISSVRIPQEEKSYFEFYDETGTDLLELRFYPCMTATAKRSLRLKNTTGMKPEIAEQLPVCQTRPSVPAADEKAQERSLRIKKGMEGPIGYSMMSYDAEGFSLGDPIIYTMELKSQQ